MRPRPLNPRETPLARAIHRGLYGALMVIARPLVRALYGANVVLESPDPIPERAVVIINHCCYLDSVMSACALWPHRLRFLSASENGRGHVWAPIVRALGTIFVGETLGETKQMLRRLTEALDAGDSIAIYPEGNLMPMERGLQDFKRGAFRIAATQGAPVVPVTLVQVRHQGLKALVGSPGFEVRVGEPITAPTGLSRARAAQYLEVAARSAMEAELEGALEPAPVDVGLA